MNHVDTSTNETVIISHESNIKLDYSLKRDLIMEPEQRLEPEFAG